MTFYIFIAFFIWQPPNAQVFTNTQGDPLGHEVPFSHDGLLIRS